ncbi:helix-turn-helix domain-containing protein [Cohnella fermenti]|nr:helix-turn-helix transcriptional regulator [Cohnella fermenti]
MNRGNGEVRIVYPATGSESLKELSGDRDRLFLVGREEPMELFGRFLSEESGERRCELWNIYGTGGVGKSCLLDSFRLLALQSGALALWVDSRDFHHKGEQLCRQLLRQLPDERAGAQAGHDPQTDPLEQCISGLQRHAASAKIVIALDTYEEMGELDGWLREQFFRRLPDNVLLLVVGRYKLKDKWIVSPVLRERMRFIPLGNLSREQCADYLRSSGITEEETIEIIWRKTRGHPLALSLAAFVRIRSEWTDSAMDEAEWFDHLAKAWLREVPDPSLRKMVEAAAVLLHVNRELLQFVLDTEVDDEAFERLISLSFVRRTDRGWMLHDLVRAAMRKQLEERAPSYYEQLRGRSAHHFAARIRHSSAYRNTEWEVGELFYYTGSSMVRTFIQTHDRGRYAWETPTLADIEEGEEYLRRRGEQATPLEFSVFDPETDERHEDFAGEEEMKLTVKQVDLRALIELDRQAVKLLRSSEGEVIGVAAIVPIHSATLAYLRADPFAGPYLDSLTAAERKLLNVAPPGQAGWFIRTIDIADWRNQDLIAEAMYLIFSYMCSGGIFVASPPPLPFFSVSHQEVGFQVVPGVVHCNYDGRTPTPTYVLDTRGEKLEKYLEFLLQRGGYPSKLAVPGSAGDKLTSREQEIAGLILDGLTNLEIAAELYVSEITVKKHVSSIYRKLEVKGRGQLIKLLVGKPVGA